MKLAHALVLVMFFGALAPRAALTQVALPGDMDPNGRVYTQIIARVGDEGTYSQPISGVTFYIVSADGQRITLRTTAGGTAATWLPRAQYRIVTPDPFQWEGKLYTWDTVATVRPGSALVRFNLANGRSRDVPIVAWTSGDPGSSEVVKDGQVFRTITRDGVSVAATVSRNRDVIWADVSVSNKSNRKIDVQPQAFVLTEAAPNHSALAHHAVQGTVVRALIPTTLNPGQDISGVIPFESDKKATEVILRVPVSRITFDIPLAIRK